MAAPAHLDFSLLAQDEVHVWYTVPEEITDPALAVRYQQVLSADEQRQHRRFEFEADRHRYLVSHALVRTTLSSYSKVLPRAWLFKAGQFGRPEVVGPPGNPPVSFNLSHTTGLAACAVTRAGPVGVDVEDVQRGQVGLDVADRYFSPGEVNQLRALPAAQRRAAFFDYWTLKESYIKARGVGLSLPLDQFTFHLEPQRPVRISFSSALDDDPQRWQFALFTPTARHKLAIAVCRPPGNELKIIVRQTVPLVPIDGG